MERLFSQGYSNTDGYHIYDSCGCLCTTLTTQIKGDHPQGVDRGTE